MSSWDAEDGERKSTKSNRGDGQIHGPFFFSLLRRASAEFGQYLHSTVGEEPVKKDHVITEVKDEKDGPCRTEEICCREVTSSTAIKVENDKGYIVTGCGNVITDDNRRSSLVPNALENQKARKSKLFAELHQQAATGLTRNDQAGFLQHGSQNDLHPIGVGLKKKRIPMEQLKLTTLTKHENSDIRDIHKTAIIENAQQEIPFMPVGNDIPLKSVELSTCYEKEKEDDQPTPIPNNNVCSNLVSTTHEFSIAVSTPSANEIDKFVSDKSATPERPRQYKTTKSNPCRADTCCRYGDAENPYAKSRIPDKKGESEFCQLAMSTLKKSTRTYGAEQTKQQSSDEYEHSFYSKGIGVTKKTPEIREPTHEDLENEDSIEVGHIDEEYASPPSVEPLSLTSFLAENLIVYDFVLQRPNFSSSSEDLDKVDMEDPNEEVTEIVVENEEAEVPERPRYLSEDVSVQCVSTLYPSNCNFRICQPECMAVQKSEPSEKSEVSSVSSEDPNFQALLKEEVKNMRREDRRYRKTATILLIFNVVLLLIVISGLAYLCLEYLNIKDILIETESLLESCEKSKT